MKSVNNVLMIRVHSKIILKTMLLKRLQWSRGCDSNKLLPEIYVNEKNQEQVKKMFFSKKLTINLFKYF